MIPPAISTGLQRSDCQIQISTMQQRSIGRKTWCPSAARRGDRAGRRGRHMGVPGAQACGGRASKTCKTCYSIACPCTSVPEACSKFIKRLVGIALEISSSSLFPIPPSFSPHPQLLPSWVVQRVARKQERPSRMESVHGSCHRCQQALLFCLGGRRRHPAAAAGLRCRAAVLPYSRRRPSLALYLERNAPVERRSVGRSAGADEVCERRGGICELS